MKLEQDPNTCAFLDVHSIDRPHDSADHSTALHLGFDAQCKSASSLGAQVLKLLQVSCASALSEYGVRILLAARRFAQVSLLLVHRGVRGSGGPRNHARVARCSEAPLDILK